MDWLYSMYQGHLFYQKGLGRIRKPLVGVDLYLGREKSAVVWKPKARLVRKQLSSGFGNHAFFVFNSCLREGVWPWPGPRLLGPQLLHLHFCRCLVSGPPSREELQVELFGCGSKSMGSQFGVGKFTTPFRAFFSGWIESDVPWYDLALDPLPFGRLFKAGPSRIANRPRDSPG